MIKMKRKLTTILAIFVCMAVIMVGCAKPAESDSSQITDSETSDAEGQEEVKQDEGEKK